jgi:ADP-ribose pyrophosphatase
MVDVFLGEPWSDGEIMGLLLGAQVASRPVPGGIWVSLSDAQRVRCDVAGGALGHRLGEVAGGLALVPGSAEPAMPVAEGRFADRGVALEMLREAAAIIEERGVEAARAAAAFVAPRAWARRRGRQEASPVALRRPLGEGDVERLGVARPYAGFFAVEEQRLRHRRFDGAMSEVLVRAALVSGDAATVLPWDAGADTVLLIEQFRPGLAARHDPRPWCLEAIAGRCDGGESPEETVRREAVEEAGLTLGRLARIGGYYTSPGISSEYITGFVGEATLGDASNGVFGCADEHEDIRTLVVPRARAMAALAEGEVNNAPLMLSLQWLALNAERLRGEWDGSEARP